MTICKSARQYLTTQFFTGRMPFLLPHEQRLYLFILLSDL